jgi:hypothetical protein
VFHTRGSTSALYLHNFKKITCLQQTNNSTSWQTGWFYLHHRRFPLVNLCSNILSSHAYGVHISQLIRYTRSCSTYNQTFIQGTRRLTKKLMLQGFLQSRLQAAIGKFYSHYIDLASQHNSPLGQMLCDVFLDRSWHTYFDCRLLDLPDLVIGIRKVWPVDRGYLLLIDT